MIFGRAAILNVFLGCGLAAAVAVCAFLATRPAKVAAAPVLSGQEAQDIMRNAAASHQETLARFKVIKIQGPYVRAVVNVPEEYTQDMPVDIMYAYGWHLVRVEPVRGRLPGPG